MEGDEEMSIAIRPEDLIYKDDCSLKFLCEDIIDSMMKDFSKENKEKRRKNETSRNEEVKGNGTGCAC